jgi:ribosomal-protein-alanine N-acetyltransferase
VHLSTDRLLLRPARLDDAEALLAYRGDPEVTRYLTHEPLDLDHARRWLAGAAVAGEMATDGRFHRMVAVERGGRMIGDLHTWNVARDFVPSTPDPTEVFVAYVFHPGYRGHGYATEAVRGLLGWLAARGARRAYANLFTDNTPSLRLLNRLGFTEVRSWSAEQDDTGRGLASARMGLDLPPPR